MGKNGPSALPDYCRQVLSETATQKLEDLGLGEKDVDNLCDTLNEEIKSSPPADRNNSL